MRRHLREAALSVVVILLTAPVFGQTRAVWRTAADVGEGMPGTVVGTATNVDDASGELHISRPTTIATDTSRS